MEKKIKRKQENEKCNVKNDWKKLMTIFFPFHFHFSTKMEIFTGKRLRSRREKIEKSDFTPGKNREK